jgi:hypothetical protein
VTTTTAQEAIPMSTPTTPTSIGAAVALLFLQAEEAYRNLQADPGEPMLVGHFFGLVKATAIVTGADESVVTRIVVEQVTDHAGHDIWPLISRPGVVWCRDCQAHFPGTRRPSLTEPRPTDIVLLDIDLLNDILDRLDVEEDDHVRADLIDEAIELADRDSACAAEWLNYR